MPKKVSPSDKIKREEEKKKNTFFKERLKLWDEEDVRTSLLACGEDEEIEEDAAIQQIGDTDDLDVVAVICGDDVEIGEKDFLQKKEKESGDFSSDLGDVKKEFAGIPFKYTQNFDLYFYTLGVKDVAGEARTSAEIWSAEVEPMLQESAFVKEILDAGDQNADPVQMFEGGAKHLIERFRMWMGEKKCHWPGRNDIFVAKKTLEMYCGNFLHALKVGGLENEDEALSTKALYDICGFLENIFAKDYKAGTLSIILMSVIRVMEKHPDISVACEQRDEKNSLYKQLRVLKSAHALVNKECENVAASNFESIKFGFDLEDVLDATVKLYDGKYALLYRRLLREFGSRAELGSTVLVHNPGKDEVERLLQVEKEGIAVIAIESHSLQSDVDYTDVSISLPVDLKISLSKEKHWESIWKTGDKDETIARSLVDVCVSSKTKAKSHVNLLSALDKSFNGKYSWQFCIFRMMQEFGCRDDLGSVQVVLNPSKQKFQKFVEDRVNSLVIKCGDGLDLSVDYLKVDELPKDLEVSIVLLRHKTSGYYALTPKRRIESEEVIRMVLDIYVQNRKEQMEEKEKKEEKKEEKKGKKEKKQIGNSSIVHCDEENVFYDLIPRRWRLVRDESISHMVTDTLKNLQHDGKNMKDISGPQAVTFLRKLLTSSLFNDAKVYDRVINGVILDRQAWKLYHSTSVHLKYYLRMIEKSKKRIDLVAHLSEHEMEGIRKKWREYFSKDKDQTYRTFTWKEFELVMKVLELAYLGAPLKREEEMTDEEKYGREAELWKVMKERKHGEYVNKEHTLTKDTMIEIIKLVIDAKLGIERSFLSVKAFINTHGILEPRSDIRQGVGDLFTKTDADAVNFQKEIIKRHFEDVEDEKTREALRAAICAGIAHF